jgi:hypothetical protein
LLQVRIGVVSVSVALRTSSLTRERTYDPRASGAPPDTIAHAPPSTCECGRPPIGQDRLQRETIGNASLALLKRAALPSDAHRPIEDRPEETGGLPRTHDAAVDLFEDARHRGCEMGAGFDDPA